MTLESALNNWLPFVGGVTGLAMLVYMGLMVWLNSRRNKEVEALRRDLAEVRGLLLGRRK